MVKGGGVEESEVGDGRSLKIRLYTVTVEINKTINSKLIIFLGALGKWNSEKKATTGKMDLRNDLSDINMA